jgi:hypothetical protein
MRSREKQRENCKTHVEERLNPRNDEGYFDLTAFCAVIRIREKDKLQDKPIKVRTSK